MDSRAFDRLIARASDPRLIPGVYNYCDSRCSRCPFTTRCLIYLENETFNSADAGASLAETVRASLRQTSEIVAGIAPREAVDVAALAESAMHASRSDL